MEYVPDRFVSLMLMSDKLVSTELVSAELAVVMSQSASFAWIFTALRSTGARIVSAKEPSRSDFNVANMECMTIPRAEIGCSAFFLFLVSFEAPTMAPHASSAIITMYSSRTFACKFYTAIFQ